MSPTQAHPAPPSGSQTIPPLSRTLGTAQAKDNDGAAALPGHFASHPYEGHPERWDACWQTSFTPWDRAAPSLALHDLLSQRADLVAPPQTLTPHGPARDEHGRVVKRTALVPGCGRGWDAQLLAWHGYDVVGLDYSERGIEEARENQGRCRREGEWFASGSAEGLERGQVSWVSADYFSRGWEDGLGTDASGKFDLIYDYTFLCALPPSARPSWSSRTTSLLHHKGRLVCLEFPSGKPLSQPGPPWGLFPEVYEALLSAPGENIEYDEDGNLVDLPSTKPRSNALHRLSLIKPDRTHKAGTADDGSVTDFISVWCS